MTMTIEGRTALVTGGAVRIGRTISAALARAGAAVAVHYRASRAAAAALVQELRREGRRALAVPGRLDTPADAERLFQRAVRAAGPLDILVNNAAVFDKDSWTAMTPAALQAELSVNLMAPMALMRAFAAQGRPGVVINLLDRRIAGLDPACVPYEISKKALAEATRSAAWAWAPCIRVNAVAPGVVLPPPGEGPNRVRDLAGWIPLGRTVPLEDIAEAVLYLIRAESITGQILFVDGGQHLAGAGPWGTASRPSRGHTRRRGRRPSPASLRMGRAPCHGQLCRPNGRTGGRA